MSGKYGEPWKIQTTRAGHGKFRSAIIIPDADEHVGSMKPIQAFRVIRCVNSCTGLSDSALESGVIERVRAVLQELTDDLERRYAEKDRGARNYLGEVVGEAKKEALTAMSDQLERAKAALKAFSPKE